MKARAKTIGLKQDDEPALTPKLRFQEFRDAEGWKTKELGEVFKVSFHGYRHFSACTKQDANDEKGVLHQRLINILSLGSYSLYEPQEMLEENKNYFRKILRDFINR